MTRVDGKTRLLVVDDEPIVQELLAEVLRAEADELVIAGGVAEARAMAGPGFTVALVDKNLPDGSGLALIGELRALVPDAAILLMTAYASLDTAIEALRAGAYDYVLKPFSSIQDLVQKVRRARERVELTRQRERLTAQLHQTARMEALGQMAGSIAHDFNNTLSVIGGTAQWLIRELQVGAVDVGELREGLATIDVAVDSAAALVRQLLTFSRRQPITPEPLELDEVIGGVQRLLRGALRGGHTLSVVRSATPSTVLADRGQLEQVLMNLVINARDAFDGSGTVTIATRVVDGTVELTVADDGRGIPGDIIARIFEPFFTTKPSGDGTGLGLATVYGVVRGFGGTIDVASAVGVGTTFTIRLPAAAAASPADPPLAAGTG